MFHGPPGGGKSTLVNLIISDVIEKGGIALQFSDPKLFNIGIRHFRQIEPDRPLVIIMEDIDALIGGEDKNESLLLNILDGTDQIDNVIFLATTNYPDKLEQRIIDRPSRFDRVIEIKSPPETVRRSYLSSLFKKYNADTYHID